MDTNLVNQIKNDQFAAHAGVKLIGIRPGYAKAEMEITPNHLNGLNMVHGAAIFTLADYAFAAASNAQGVPTVAINVNISYFKSPKGRRLIAEAQEVSAGKKLCTYKVDIFDEQQELIASFTGMGYKKQSS